MVEHSPTILVSEDTATRNDYINHGSVAECLLPSVLLLSVCVLTLSDGGMHSGGHMSLLSKTYMARPRGHHHRRLL